MITVLAVTIGVTILLVLSVRERMKLSLSRQKSWEVEPKQSPLSQALVNLIGVAGGIYLSLTLLFTFLELDIPQKIKLGGIETELLATVSIALAIVQPFLINLYRLITNKKSF
ncbi:MAG: hypothetical protein H0Z39_06480 [Peptococcaceae bacterium]|nr:hypothetical protein [Peptococcaceae bacterium]